MKKYCKSALLFLFGLENTDCKLTVIKTAQLRAKIFDLTVAFDIVLFT